MGLKGEFLMEKKLFFKIYHITVYGMGDILKSYLNGLFLK